jgi:hypothetical protein
MLFCFFTIFTNNRLVFKRNAEKIFNSRLTNVRLIRQQRAIVITIDEFRNITNLSLTAFEKFLLHATCAKALPFPRRRLPITLWSPYRILSGWYTFDCQKFMERCKCLKMRQGWNHNEKVPIFEYSTAYHPLIQAASLLGGMTFLRSEEN